MKKLALILAFLFAWTLTANATDITVAATTQPNFNPSGLPADVTLSNVATSTASTSISCSACFRPQWVGLGGFRITINGTAATVSYVTSTSSATLTANAPVTSSTATVVWYKYVELRFYSNMAFQPNGATYVVQPGTPGSASWYKRVAASIVNVAGVNTLYIPELTIAATTDATGVTTQARYTAGFYRPDGSLVSYYYCFDNFVVPTTTPTTWVALCAYNSPPAIVPPNNEAYTKPQIDARFPSCTSGQMLYYAATGNVQTCLNVGSGLSISGGTITATGGGGGSITGSGTTDTLTYWTGTSAIGTALLGNNLQFASATLKAKRVREAYNAVLDYGAVGDGVTDDTTAVQNCLTASAGVNAFDCYLPAGDYLVTGLTLTDGAKLIGDGKLESTLISTTNAPILNVSGTCLGCTVRRIGVLGSKTAGTSQVGLNLAGSSYYYGVIVDDVRIEETGAAGLKITQPYSSTFKDIFLDDTAGFPLDYNAPTAPANTFQNIYVGVVNTTATVGFRIRSGDFVCTECNGVNSSPTGGSWASVGTKNGVDGDTADAGARFTCIHCNIESFNTYGILAYSYSEINLIGKTTLSGNAAGTEKAIYFDNVGDGASGCTTLPACGFYSQFIARGYIDDTVDFADGVGAYANSQPIHTRSGFAHIQTLGQGPLTGGGNQLTTYYDDTLGSSLKLARADGKSSVLAVSSTTSITQPGVKYIEADSSGGAITISIPWAGWYQRAQEPLIIKDVGGAAATNNITISGVGGTVNGSSYVISNNGDSVMLMPDGNTGAGDWRVVSGGGSTSLPVPDTQTIVKGSVDATKLLRFEVDGFTTGATRILTPPDSNITIAGQDYANTFSALNTFNIGATPAASLLVTTNAIGSAGTRDSGWLVLRGQSDDGSAHTVDWKQVVNVTGNDGTSTFRIENRVDSAAYDPVFWLTKLGDLQTYSLLLYGKTINTDATNSYMLSEMLGTMTKNDTNTRNFYGVYVYPEINTGGSNTNTTFQVLQIDTLNTGTTGVTTNLINAAYGGTTVFKVGSAGHVTIGGGTTASELRFLEPSGSGTNYTAFKAQAQGSDVTYTLPSGDGTSGQCLSTNGSGSLSWGACSAGSPGSAALTATYVGYGDGSNLLTGEAAFTYNATTDTLATAHQTITQTSTSTVPLIVKAVGSSSVEMVQVKDSSGNVRGGWSTAGAFFFRGFSSAPTASLANDGKLFYDITGGVTTQQLLLSKNTGTYNPVVVANQASYTSTRLVRWSGTSWEVDDISGATSNGTSVTFSSGNLIATTPTITTSLVTASTTFALLNTTATTINFAGAATTLNIGASAATVLNFGGGTSAAEFRFLEPSASGTNYTGFKAQAQAANVTYTLPAADGTSGYVLSTNGSGALSWIPAGGAASLTVGSSPVASGTATRLFYETAGNVLGEITGATSDGTNVTFGSGNLIATSPSITTSITTGSATFALLNTTATTINFGGAATTINMAGGSGAVVKLGGGASSAELRFYEPSASGTNYTAIKATAQAGDVTYLWPNADGTSGYCLSTNGSGTLSWVSCSGGGGGLTVGTTAIASGTAGRILYETSGNVLGEIVGSAVTADGAVTFAAQPRTSGVASYFVVYAPADTTMTASTESPGIAFEMSATRQWATGALPTQREAVFYAPTYAFAGASTLTNAATVAITGAPTAGTNASITNAYSLWIQGGTLRHDGATFATNQTTYNLLNSTPTTINFGGAATTMNIGGSGAAIKLGGGATAATLRFMEPSGSGTNYTAFKAQAQAGDVTYTLPDADGTSGYVLSTNGSGTLSWVAQSGGGLTVGTTAIASGTAGRILYETSGNVLGEIAGSSVDANGAILFAHTARTSGTGYYFAVQNTTDTGLTTASESVGLYFDLSANRTWAAGNITTQRETAFLAPTYTISGGASTISNAATVAISGPPIAGASTTITRSSSLWIQTGNLRLGSGTSASELRFFEPSGSGTNYMAFKAQAMAADVTYTLPAADGSSGQFLSTNGSGTLSWATGGGGLTIGTTAITSGTVGRILYEASGNVLGEAAGITYQTGASPTVTITAQAASYVGLRVNSASTPSTNIFSVSADAGTTAHFAVTSTGAPSAPDGPTGTGERFGAGSSVNTSFGTNSIAFGKNATAIGPSNVAVGYSVTTGGGAVSNAMAIGSSVDTGNTTNSIKIGYNLTTFFLANSFIVGNETTAISEIYFGKGYRSGTPVAVTVHGTDAYGTDIAGAAINIAGGAGTGTGTGGGVNIQFARAGTTGSSLNSLSTIMAFSGTTTATTATQTNVNGATTIQGQITENITLNTGGTTTDSTIDLPANSIILSVTARITTTITTATDWSVGDPTTSDRFSSANSTLTAGTTSVGINQWKADRTTAGQGPYQASTAKVRITTTGTPGAGAIRITVHYLSMSPPTS